MHGQCRLPLDADGLAQAVDRQAFYDVVRGVGFAVEQQILSIAPHDEVEQALALRRKEAGPDGQFTCDIVRDESLKEFPHVRPR